MKFVLPQERLKYLKNEPKVTDRVDSVSKAGASEMMREVNIRKRFALLYHLSFLIYPLAKR